MMMRMMKSYHNLLYDKYDIIHDKITDISWNQDSFLYV